MAFLYDKEQNSLSTQYHGLFRGTGSGRADVVFAPSNAPSIDVFDTIASTCFIVVPRNLYTLSYNSKALPLLELNSSLLLVKHHALVCLTKC